MSNSTLGIIPCSKEKIWDLEPWRSSVLAGEAYRSSFHRLSRRYVEHRCSRWVILSAKYGFMDPTDEISGPYDVIFGGGDPNCISDARLKSQVIEKGLFAYKTVCIVCTISYSNRIQAAFEDHSPQHETPLRGVGGWGSMHTWLRNAVPLP
jgi:hypothetical protein